MAIKSLICVAGLILAGCAPDPESQADQLARMKAQCTQAMIATTCRVMQGPARSQLPQNTSTVLVAGLGPIDANLYRKLREQGDSMCQHLVSVCEQNWHGNTCLTARSLYGVRKQP